MFTYQTTTTQREGKSSYSESITVSTSESGSFISSNYTTWSTYAGYSTSSHNGYESVWKSEATSEQSYEDTNFGSDWSRGATTESWSTSYAKGTTQWKTETWTSVHANTFTTTTDSYSLVTYSFTDTTVTSAIPVGSSILTHTYVYPAYTSKQTSTSFNVTETDSRTVYDGLTSTYLSTYTNVYAQSTSTWVTESTTTYIGYSQVLTVNMNPYVEIASVFQRGTAERMFTLTSQFQGTTKALSQCLSEVNAYTFNALTVSTNDTFNVTLDVSSSRTTASTDAATVYLDATESVSPYTVAEPSANTNPYFGGYNLGTTTVSWGAGPFDLTYQNLPGGVVNTQRFTYGVSAVSTYTNSNLRISPLKFITFGSTLSYTTDSVGTGLGIFTYNTTALAAS